MVSLAIGAMCYGICHQLVVSNKEWYGLFVFSSTFITYNIQRLIKAFQEKAELSNHLKWVLKNQTLLHFLIIASSFLCGFSFFKFYHHGIGVLIILLLSGIISLFYVLKLRSKNLREIPFLKIHLVALVCTIASGVFILINEGDFSLKNWLFVAIHDLYFVAVTIPFDIRDLKYDDPDQKTIPQVLGIEKAKIVSALLLVFYLFLCILIQTHLIQNIIFLLAIIFTFTLIFAVDEKRFEFYYSGMIEGSIIVVGLSFLFQ